MTIGAGVRLGPYEILAPLGAGGMGEVYRAKDTRLNRTVAIKVLPAHAVDNPEQRQRLDREARAIATLTHPHICTLYDIGHQDGIDYLVMEYLQGDTLAERLEHGPLPIDQVFKFAIEIADALDKAHRAGIVHRDLKPGNVMLTKAGTKLLDFGLAKTMEHAGLPRGALVTDLPTSPANLTAKGLILGTLQYMAPEQLHGKDADARTDIFALGTVIYEMTTGKKAFTGESQASLIAAILDTTPPAISMLQPLTPPALDHVVTTCLAKDPDERWQTAGDVKRQLAWIAQAGTSAGLVMPIRAQRQRWKGLGMVTALLMSALVASLITSGVMRSTTTVAPIIRAVLPLPAGAVAPAISPDGTHVAYVMLGGSQNQLYVQALDQLTGTPVPRTEDASSPFFSPDGRWIGFIAGTRLEKVPLSGGQPTTICEVVGIGAGTAPRGASWGPDDTIVFNTGNASGLSSVSAGGGTPRVLTVPDRDRREKSHRWPEILPGGEAVIFMNAGADIASFDDARIEVLSLKTGARRVLIEGGSNPAYAASGHLLYLRAGSLFAAAFDVGRLELTGTPVRILDGVDPLSHVGISRVGSLVYRAGSGSTLERTLLSVDRQGTTRPMIATRRAFGDPQFSPDGRKLALGVSGQVNDEIWIDDVERDTLSRLTASWNNYGPVWTADGTRIAFSSDRSGIYNLFWQLADGSGPVERLTTSTNGQAPLACSPDGAVLAFQESSLVTGEDIWMLPLDGDRTPRPFLQDRFNEGGLQFSPNGRWVAYYSDESGRWETYVRPYPGPGGKWQISNDGGGIPRWAPNGRELFYRSGSRSEKLMTVGVTTQETFSATKPQLLIQGFPGGLESNNYAVSPDGQHFVAVSDIPEEPPTQINLVLNWFEELKRKAPSQ